MKVRILNRLVPIVVLAATLACCASSQAAFSPFTLVSGDPTLQLQADYAYDPAVSANGEYVAYAGSIASKKGIYRTYINPTTHKSEATEQVALGGDTGAPSISADGRYVSFTTNDNPATGEAPTPTSSPAGECSSVYVRDMSKGPQEAGAYTLVSAADESSESLAYAPPTPKFQSCGAASASRVAISADGSEVVFTVLSPSSLTGSCTAAPVLECPTPPDQVAVRNLDTQRTTLVSVTRASVGGVPQPVPAGAALASLAIGSRFPAAASTAAISSDGSTVAWMGTDVAEQVPITTPLQAFDHESFPASYAEPLWRRIADGSTAPTRRILAGDDASAPSCPPECAGGLNLEWNGLQEIVTGEYTGAAPAYGSYTEKATAATGFEGGTGLEDPLDAATPQLSANGMKVALVSTQPDAGLTPTLPGSEIPTANAFVVNMTPGLTRAQAITRLTEWGSIPFKGHLEQDGAIENITISPDGSRVAFSTKRSYFPLAPPALITPPVGQTEFTQVYEANLAGGTLALVSQGYNGEPANGLTFGVALSGNGETLALASAANNLSFGAVYKEGSDVYATHEESSPTVAGVQSVTPLPAATDPASPWQISATSHSANGALIVNVSVPGNGSLAVSANAPVPTTETDISHERQDAKARKAKARKVTVIATRQVAHTVTTTTGMELVKLRLTPANLYRSLMYGKGGLYATITLTFTATDHPRLTATLEASFQASLGHKASKSKTKSTKQKAPKRPAKRERR